MVNKVTENLIKQLKKANLSTEDRTALITALLVKLNAPPIGEMIHFTQNGLMINGKMLDTDGTISFTKACTALKDNYARKVIHEQVRYKAIDLGIDKGTTIDTIMFSKAALWVLNELEILTHRLSTEG